MNCASVGCPPIRSEPFEGSRLDSQLEEQTRAFLTATSVVDPDRMEIRVTQLFEWFAADFESVGGVREFLAARLPQAEAIRNERNVLVYTTYDWALNGVSSGE